MQRTLLAALSALAIAAPVAAQGMKLSDTDRAFISKAAGANAYELEAARMARSMSSSAEIKAFADQIITDHTKLGADLTAAVKQADSSFVIPATLDQMGQAKLDALHAAGDRFDAVYKEQMVTGHADVAKAFDDYAECTDANPGIRAVVRDAIPTIRRHKDMAKELPSK